MPIMSHIPVRQMKRTPFVRLADKGFCKSLNTALQAKNGSAAYRLIVTLIINFLIN
jgi:hypothetical protein